MGRKSVNFARTLLALLMCAMGASETLLAQARGPGALEARSNEKQAEKSPDVLDETSRARKIAEMEDWLRRLIGVYRVDGKVAMTDRILEAQSSAVCAHVGDGPGVGCAIGDAEFLQDPALLERAAADTESISHVALPPIFFGINPDTLEIQQMTEGFGDVVGRSGTLAGDTVDFSTDIWKVCNRIPVSHCWTSSEINAKPAGDVVMKVVMDIRVQGKLMPSLVVPGHSQAYELHLRRDLSDARKLRTLAQHWLEMLSASGTGSADSRSIPAGR